MGGSLNGTLTEVGAGGRREPEEEGADEQHRGDAVHGARQRPRPRRLPPSRRRQRVVRRQRRLAHAGDAAATSLRDARPARRPPHPRARPARKRRGRRLPRRPCGLVPSGSRSDVSRCARRAWRGWVDAGQQGVGRQAGRRARSFALAPGRGPVRVRYLRPPRRRDFYG
ncbi:hypothetical protein GQ55_4G093400 [Panicum hallii var. hallii]|uniref:Uncharacterized protein n=1 Tax=Panicum hallii var. hallii TaxID=1504633 RepID=A0A2T7DWX8_9POAL|nr:hypothetical protein GQ55_4G093400 [Panicum hallii var. hallii]